MKGLIHTGLSTLLLAIAIPSTTLPAIARPARDRIALPTLISLTPKAPTVMDSGVLGNNHFIRIAVAGMSLEDLMITLPEQMERFDGITVSDRSGRPVPAKIMQTQTHITITFDQPVTPGNDLNILFKGVEKRGAGGETLFYSITAERVGITGDIPVGLARVDVPSRD